MQRIASANKRGRTITTFSSNCVWLQRETFREENIKENTKKDQHVNDVTRVVQKRQCFFQCVASQIEWRRNLRRNKVTYEIQNGEIKKKTSLSMQRKLTIPWSLAANISEMMGGHVSFSSSSRDTNYSKWMRTFNHSKAKGLTQWVRKTQIRYIKVFLWCGFCLSVASQSK